MDYEDDPTPDDLLAKGELEVAKTESAGYGGDVAVTLQKAQTYALLSIAASLSEIAKLS